MSQPKLLLATPVFDGKEYAVGEWLRRASQYTYPHHVMLVDNSESDAFYQRWHRDYPMTVQRVNAAGQIYFERLTQAAEAIRKHALNAGFDLWLNLDVDEYGPPNLLDYLIELLGDADVLCHASPNRQLDQWIDHGFGCTLFTRRVLECFSFLDCPPDFAHDVWFFRWIRQRISGGTPPEFKVKQTRGTLILEHWDGQGAERITAFPDGRQYELKLKLGE